MNKDSRIQKVSSLIDSLNDLHIGISNDVRFEYRLDGSSIYVRGLSDDLAHLYLLLHSGVANVCVYLQWTTKGMELEIMINA